MKKVSNKKSNIAWIAAFCGCLVFAAAMLGGTLMLMKENASSRNALENVYERSFFDMADSMNNIEVNLSKMLVSASEEQTIEMAGEISRQSQLAQTSINQLPLNAETAHDINKYLNQVGDWCTSYTRALLSEGETGLYEDKVEDLYAITRGVNASIKEIGAKFDGNYRITRNLKREGIRSLENFSDSYDTLQNSTMEYPELIYDGPFSDREGAKSFKALDQLEEISEQQAKETCMRIFRHMNLSNLVNLGTTTEPAAYVFDGKIDGGSMYICISQKGGKIISADTDLDAGAVRVTKEKAKEKALAYADMCDYCDDLVPVWYNSINGIAFVNLAPKVNDIIYYGDLVKVKVGLDDGKLMGIEAMGFCTNNCKREMSPTISERTAKSMVSQKLTVHETRVALIPINQKEVLCYEVACEYKGLDYFVYIDARSGKQVNILRVVDEDQGEMVF